VCSKRAADTVDGEVCGVVVDGEDWSEIDCRLLDWCFRDWYFCGSSASCWCKRTQLVLLGIHDNDY
jgi:hypothetical protein